MKIFLWMCVAAFVLYIAYGTEPYHAPPEGHAVTQDEAMTMLCNDARNKKLADMSANDLSRLDVCNATGH